MKLLPYSFLAFEATVRALELQIPISTSAVKDIPSLGFGTWNLDTSNASDVVSVALHTGYRHIDCAAAYSNQKEVGKGLVDGMKKAKIDRSAVWITSKLWNDHHEASKVEAGLNQTLSDLGLSYLDLYLMHWPVASSHGKTSISYIDTWQAMIRLLDTGKVRHIGISNFSPVQMLELKKHSDVKPYAHQMEMHPYLQQPDFLQFHQEGGIHVTAYSPLGNTNPTYGSPSNNDDAPPPLLENDVIRGIAAERGCTTAQVALAWGLSRGTSVIPKSAHAARIKENFETTKCMLEVEDFTKIRKLGEKKLTRFNNPGKGWGVKLFEGLDGA